MERKTKHRILGILVVLALVVILIPFFEGGSDPVADATIVRAPSFPDQAQTPSTQAALNPPLTLAQTGSDINQQPDDTISANSPSHVSATQAVINPPVQKQETKEQIDSKVDSKDDEDEQAKTAIEKEEDKNLPKTEIKNVNEEKDSNKNESTQNVSPIKTAENKQNPSDLGKVVEKTEPENVAPPIKQLSTKNLEENTLAKTNIAKVTKHAMKKVAQTAKRIFVPQIKPFVPEGKPIALNSPIDANGLAKLKNAAWVIQIGSFKNKTNALRLVNKLRANGYRAFIQQVDNGDGTRVFVGPEPKQTTARSLASQLESNLHIRGIVISYKPLAL